MNDLIACSNEVEEGKVWFKACKKGMRKPKQREVRCKGKRIPIIRDDRGKQEK